MAVVSSLNFNSAADLLAHVLCQGVGRILRKGLDRGYVEQEEILNLIRGRIDVNHTGRHNLHRRGRALCRFDEFEFDILQNRIIKSTIRLLLRLEGLSEKLRKELWLIYKRLPNISEIELDPSVFPRVTIHRNNRYYRFLLHVCELIVSYTMPDEQRGKYRFKEFWRDEVRMRLLFQDFVFYFYQKEQTAYAVKSDVIKWPAEALSPGREEDLLRLPKMLTDVSLRSSERTIILDTKYYAEVLQSKYQGKGKVNSANLYQIHAYLKSLEAKQYPDNKAEGILLYPTNGYEVDLAWKISGHVMRVRTIDLGRDWRDISKQLLDIIGGGRIDRE